MKLKALFLAAAAVAMTSSAHAASKTLVFSVAEFMAKAENAEALNNFTFQWGSTPSGSQLGAVNTRGRPANSFHKDDQEACERALLNSLLAMREAALAKGGTKVTGVHAVNGAITNPSTEYVCIINHFVAKTPLNGTAAK